MFFTVLYDSWSLIFYCYCKRTSRKINSFFYHIMCKVQNGSNPYSDIATAWKTWDFILVAAKHFSFPLKPPVRPCGPPSPLVIWHQIPCTEVKAAGAWSSPLRLRMSAIILLLLFCASWHGEGQIWLLRVMIFNTLVLTSSTQIPTSVEDGTVIRWSLITQCAVHSRLIFAAIPSLTK